MDDYIYEVGGAPVIYSDAPPEPHNPLNRPSISFKRPIIALVVYLVVTAVLIVASAVVLPGWGWWLWLGWSVLNFAVIAKRALIWCVHLYQNKAPDKVRLRCVFEPSCSEYMILAVNKYGFLVGVLKGINRLLRCHPPNGGVDYP